VLYKDARQDVHLVTAAEQILKQIFGSKVQLMPADQLGGSGRSDVARFLIKAGPTEAPKSIIVKYSGATANANQTNSSDASSELGWGLSNDWAGVQFLDEVFDTMQPAPRLYGGNQKLGLIVLEDLGASKTLGSILQGNDPVAAETVLLQLMTTLGWIHAHTIGKYHKYQRIRMSLGPEIPFFSTIAEGSLEPEQIATIFHTTAKTLVHDQAAFSEMTRCDCGAQP